jgi:hypothetical protein
LTERKPLHMVATTKATKLNQMEGISIILHTEAFKEE